MPAEKQPGTAKKRKRKRNVTERRITIEGAENASDLFGNYDSNMRAIENEFGVSVAVRGGEIRISGENEENTEKAFRVIRDLSDLLRRGQPLDEQNVRYCMSMVNDGEPDTIGSLTDGGCICITSRGKAIRPKTLGQKKYCELIDKNTITIGIGPAGTGKTYLAVAMAVTAFKAQKVTKIILTRPAVEAGEKLGFLPGDLQQKVDPYLRPLYDALFDMLGAETYQKYLEKGSIEVAPLAYMRGRTLDDSFIILDEAQNTTPEQMKMFLTRLGFNSKAIVTGDITQTDLPFGKKSGLKEAVKILDGIEGIAVHRFTEKDVVRHRLVQRIILAYEKYERQNEAKNAEENAKRIKRYVKIK